MNHYYYYNEFVVDTIGRLIGLWNKAKKTEELFAFVASGFGPTCLALPKASQLNGDYKSYI